MSCYPTSFDNTLKGHSKLLLKNGEKSRKVSLPA